MKYGIDDHLINQPCPPGWVGIGPLTEDGVGGWEVELYVCFATPELAVRIVALLNGTDQ